MGLMIITLVTLVTIGGEKVLRGPRRRGGVSQACLGHPCAPCDYVDDADADADNGGDEMSTSISCRVSGSSQSEDSWKENWDQNNFQQ